MKPNAKGEKMDKEGVCCACQSVHPVVPRRTTVEDLDDDFLDFFQSVWEEDCFDYVMCSHDVPDTNYHCDGSGTEPQALVTAAQDG